MTGLPGLAPTMALLAFATIVSCEKPTAPGAGGSVAAMDVVSGQNQSDTVGKELAEPIVVRVVDAQGNPVAGQAVNFHVTAGGGSVFAGTAITTAAGIAKERWTLGTVALDTQRVEVRAVDAVTGDAIVFARFAAVGVADVPASLKALGGFGEEVGAGDLGPDSLEVLVKDTYGNVTPNVTVNWAAVSGGGAVAPATSTTNASGIARTTYRGGSIPTTAYATATVGTGVASFPIYVVGGVPAQIVIQRPASGAIPGAEFSVQPIVRLVDQFGNTSTRATAVVVLSASSGAAVNGAETLIPNAGFANYFNTGMSGSPGSYTLTYSTVSNGSTISATQPIDLALGPPHHYVVTSSAPTAEVGSTIDFQAQLVDVGGNSLAQSGRTVAWSRIGANGTFANASSTTNASGIATTSFTLAGAYTDDSVRVIATESSLTGFRRVGVSRGAASKIIFKTQPTGVGYGAVFSTKVAATDAFDNTIPGSRTFSIALASGAGPLFGTTQLSTTDGTATFANLRFDNSGSGYSLQASSGAFAATSAMFSVSPIGSIPVAIGTKGFDVSQGRLWFVGSVMAASMDVTGGAMDSIGAVDNSFVRPFGRVLRSGSTLYALMTAGFNTASQSVQLFPSGVFRQLLDGCGSSGDLETDGVYLYGACSFSLGGGARRVMRLDPATNQRVILQSNGSTLDYPPIAISGNTLYTVSPDGSALESMPTSGGTAAAIATGLGLTSVQGSRRMIIADGYVYWAQLSAPTAPVGSIWRVPVTGGSPVQIFSSLSGTVNTMVRDGGYIYFIDGGSIKRFALADPAGTLQTIITSDGAIDLALDATSLYWLKSGTQPLIRKMAK